MVRRIEVTVPKAKANEVMRALQDVSSRAMHGLTKFEAETTVTIVFRCKDKHARRVVLELGKVGVGFTWGIIDVLPLQMTKPRVGVRKIGDNDFDFVSMTETRRQKKAYATTERQTIEAIYEIVDSQNHLTFDFMALTVVAGIIAAVGLITDSSVTVVASMLVSPLMGPIIGIAFGYLVEDRRMMCKGIRNELIGVALTLLTGVICGAFSLIANDDPRMTFEMESRGTIVALLAGAVAAIPSGMGVALSVSNVNTNSLVGVAISAALLPPIVNSGICVVYGLNYKDENLDWYRAGGISFSLFLMNWVLIFAFANATFVIKGVTKTDMGAAKAVWDGRIFSSFNDRKVGTMKEKLLQDENKDTLRSSRSAQKLL